MPNAAVSLLVRRLPSGDTPWLHCCAVRVLYSCFVFLLCILALVAVTASALHLKDRAYARHLVTM